MIRKVLREFFLLPRGEQRAMVLLSLLLIITLGVRTAVQMRPGKEPPGLEQFAMESQQVMASLAEADSLKRARKGTRPSRAGSAKPAPAMIVAPININTADSAGLLPLPGIGPVFAGRIIRYRELLGGYVDKCQLTEVYGLSEETLLLIAPYIYIDTAAIEMLMINSADFRTLLRHPYLEYESVKAIVKYRDMTGGISSMQEIRQHMLVPDSVLERICGYLDLSSR
jgi:DNA uptake protein ComE-like DNA-binding protein